MKIINEITYLSDESKVFVNKKTKEVMGWGICLGDNDSIENYDEVDCPEEHKGNQDYDNTVKKVVKTPKINLEIKPIVEYKK